MTRIAGKARSYGFRLVKEASTGHTIATEHGFELPSVTTFIKEVLGIPAQAMSWSGYRLFRDAAVNAFAEDPNGFIDAVESPDLLEAFLKERGVSPNLSLHAAGARGSAAHEVLELIANDQRKEAETACANEEGMYGTRYGDAAIAWWDEQIAPYLQTGEIVQVRSEMPVWSLKYAYCGTLDLAVQWAGELDVQLAEALPGGWEILDAKTHKPARGFTKLNQGPGYISDAVQCRAYRMAWEEMGMGPTIGQRAVVLRESGKWLEDKRSVTPEFVVFLRKLYSERVRFEGGIGE